MGCADALDAGAGGPCGVGPGGAPAPGATGATGATGADGLGGGGAEDFFAKPLAPRSGIARHRRTATAYVFNVGGRKPSPLEDDVN